ncbi:hypothetical protein LINPERPRIM_LOCUS27587 [Linum perenne]
MQLIILALLLTS